MWFFRSPFIVFGEDGLSHLEQVIGRRAFIVTDAVMQKLGYVQKVQDQLAIAGIISAYFEEVEPEPSLKSVHACARVLSDFEPDWVVGLRGRLQHRRGQSSLVHLRAPGGRPGKRYRHRTLWAAR